MSDFLNEGSDSGAPGAQQHSDKYLSAEWINARIMNVRAQARKILLERIIRDGLLSSGYKPFQFPITDEMLMRMTPEQAQRLIDAQPSIGAKTDLLARLKALKVPPLQYLQPRIATPHIPTQAAIDEASRTSVPLARGESV